MHAKWPGTVCLRSSIGLVHAITGIFHFKIQHWKSLNGAASRYHLTLLHANNKVADQTAQRLFVRYLESLVVNLAACKLSIFLSVPLAEQALFHAKRPKRSLSSIQPLSL